jgi:hypothetical protein
LTIKTFIIILASLSFTHTLQGQVWCDSTYAVCDSVFIDSLTFAYFPTRGDRVIVFITTQHERLYAPTFVICPANDSVDFEMSLHFYTSLYGPVQVHPFYEFLDLNTAGDTLSGYIVLDNGNNEFESCRMPFHVATPSGGSTGFGDRPVENMLDVFPNPTHGQLFIRNSSSDTAIEAIYLTDVLGRTKRLDLLKGAIDLGRTPAGWYLLVVTLSDSSMITKRIFVG